MKTSEINSYLLDYYTTLTQHHRTKISLLGGLYLSASQILLLTSVETIKKAAGNDVLIFVIGIAAVITILYIGVLHHIGSLSIIATQRLNVLRGLYFELLPENSKSSDHQYEIWSKKFNNDTRDSFSLSKLSAVFSLLKIYTV